jgi:hypothetical protein
VIDGLKQELELTRTKTVHLSQKLSESQHEINLLRDQLKSTSSAVTGAADRIPKRDNFLVDAPP